MIKGKRKGRFFPDLEEYIATHYIEEPADDAPVPDFAMAGAAFSAHMEAARKKGFPGMGASAKASAPREEVSDACFAALPDEEEFEDALSDEDEYDFDEEEHTSGIDERIKHLSDPFSVYLMYLIERNGLSNAEVYKNALIDKKVFSKIKNNPDYHPQKMTAMCLCVGARLNIDDTIDLLGRAGYALSPSDKTDVIFRYFIEKEIYDMIELDIQLEEHGLKCLIS